MSDQEAYPEGWVNVNLMINKETHQIHVISGDREGHDPTSGCDSDAPYTGYEILKSMMSPRK